MRFLNGSNSQIEKVASQENSRYGMQNVYFDAQRCHLVASNGHALVVVHVVPEEGDVTGYITPAALQAWRKALAKTPKYGRQNQTRFQALEDKLVVTDFEGQQQTFARPAKGQFANYDAVFPEVKTDKPAFTLDINLLLKTAMALGWPDTLNSKQSTMVAVFPSADNKSPHLVKTTKNGPIGIIMPMRADDEKDGWLTSLKAVDEHFRIQLNQATAAAVAKEQTEEKRIAEAKAGIKRVLQTEDGVKFYEYADGSLGDNEDPDAADLYYNDLEELLEHVTVTVLSGEPLPLTEAEWRATKQEVYVTPDGDKFYTQQDGTITDLADDVDMEYDLVYESLAELMEEHPGTVKETPATFNGEAVPDSHSFVDSLDDEDNPTQEEQDTVDERLAEDDPNQEEKSDEQLDDELAERLAEDESQEEVAAGPKLVKKRKGRKAA